MAEADRQAVLIGPWRKATFSEPGGCVELAPTTHGVAMRDTKDHGHGPVLHFTAEEFDAFLAGCKSGQFDDLT